MGNAMFENLFIFEMANNHQGSVEHGLKIIRAMGEITRKYGINAAVKYQYRDLETFIHPDFLNSTENKHIARFLGTRLTQMQFVTLLEATRAEGMKVVVTPFDEVSVDLCVKHDVDIIKVASASISDWPLLEKVTSARKPIIASTGGATLRDIDNVVTFFNHQQTDFAILHCVSTYPTPNDQVYMGFLSRIMGRFPNLVVGYSGHEAPTNTDVVQVAVAMGAQILERHVGVPTETITLNKYSMNPEETDAWVAAALRAQAIIGSRDNKVIEEVELESLRDLQRGVFARVSLKKGETITADKVFFAMPRQAQQLTSGEFGQRHTEWVASKDYAANEAVFEKSIHSAHTDHIHATRAIVHQAKGMLSEARIELGTQFEIELSHHYGLEKFHETGAIIVTLINRQYCKKLVIVLPGQAHPSHHHQKKEESFQLLWGDLKLTIDDETFDMMPGDIQLVERGRWHNFSSQHGAIFEEISTTHIKGDSYYADPKIARLDIIERKTQLEEW